MQKIPAESPNPKRKPRWFQFSLRSLLIFTAICAVTCAWLSRKIEQKRLEREAVEAIRGPAGQVSYDWEQADRGNPGTEPTSPGPEWLKSLLGENFFAEVESVICCNLPKDGDKFIARFTKLKTLTLIGPTITDATLANLSQLNELESLQLQITAATDAGLEHLEGMNRLRDLELFATPFTDSGLAHLRGLTQLEKLRVAETNVTAAGVESLKKSMPKCRIYYYEKTAAGR